MNTKLTLIMTLAAAMVLAAGCKSTPSRVVESEPRTSYTEEAQGKAITNSAAQEARAHDFVEIQFKPGSAILTEDAKSSLRDLISQAGRSGKIDEVLVLSWSDEEYPSANAQALPKQQRELADKRNAAVSKYIKSAQNVDVDAYNMAKQPNTMQRWFNTTDYRLKKSFVSAGLPTTADDPQYPSKASHSVVLVKVE